MKPERLWFGLVFLAWLAGVVVWIASDAPGVPRLSVWIWIAAFALAFVPVLIGIGERLFASVFSRHRD